MIKVVAEDFIKPEFIDIVKPLYAELVEKTRQEELCIEYDLFVDQDDLGHFIFIEKWPDRRALSIHCNSEHFTRLVPEIDKYSYKEGTAFIMDAFENK